MESERYLKKPEGSLCILNANFMIFVMTWEEAYSKQRKSTGKRNFDAAIAGSEFLFSLL